MSDLLAAARRYAELGFPVFPCAPGRKSPLTAHGFQDATCNVVQLDSWWRQYPTANVAIATAGLVVVDVDGRDNSWLDEEPERTEDLLRGAVAITPRGGRHYYFRQPDGVAIRCSTGLVAPQVDVRANGGYVLLPPSQVGGQAYHWVDGLELEAREQLPVAPKWLLERLEPLPLSTSSASAIANEIPPGQRNATLTRLGGSMRRNGMSRREIDAALQQVNQDRCIPPLSPAEVANIAASLARYAPDEVATAISEDHWSQGPGKSADPQSVGELLENYPMLRTPIIHGLLREGETMNVIASSKMGKSWLVTDLALSVATGRDWLESYRTEQGNVLIIDNELHAETSAHRIPKVMEARQVRLQEIATRLFITNMRGSLRDICGLGEFFKKLEKGQFKLIILDAFYRFMPPATDENDNGKIAQVYNLIDLYADRLGCAFVLVHHSSKGNQSGKAVTDVGAGAGSQSRATDTHLVLRPHEENEVIVLDAAVRSWPPINARCLRWTFPVWTPDDALDPTALRPERPRRRPKSVGDEADAVAPVVPKMDPASFASAFVSPTPELMTTITEMAIEAGLSGRCASRLLRQAEAQGLIYRWRTAVNQPVRFASTPPP